MSMSGKKNIFTTIKKKFPLLTYHKELAYFDSAATSQKHEQVLAAMDMFYRRDYGAVHRGIYRLAEQATELYEQARATVARFIQAQPDEIIFTSGATEGINFVVTAWASRHLNKGDEIILTMVEHHANLLPWYDLAQKKGLVIKHVRLSKDGSLDYQQYESFLSSKTKLVSFVHCSHVLGFYTPAREMIAKAHAVGARVLLDVAQSVPHKPISVIDINPDFLVFSGHKMMGPTGIGVLYCSRTVQSEMSPYKFGGGMIADIMMTDGEVPSMRYRSAPYCYEAGTPPVAEAIGLAAAVNVFNEIDRTAQEKYETKLMGQLLDGLNKISRVTVLGSQELIRKEGHLLSFMVKGIHAHDVASYCDQHDSAVRAGKLCAFPLFMNLDIESSVRASLFLYNTEEDIDKLVHTLKELVS